MEDIKKKKVPIKVYKNRVIEEITIRKLIRDLGINKVKRSLQSTSLGDPYMDSEGNIRLNLNYDIEAMKEDGSFGTTDWDDIEKDNDLFIEHVKRRSKNNMIDIHMRVMTEVEDTDYIPYNRFKDGFSDGSGTTSGNSRYVDFTKRSNVLTRIDEGKVEVKLGTYVSHHYVLNNIPHESLGFGLLDEFRKDNYGDIVPVFTFPNSYFLTSFTKTYMVATYLVFKKRNLSFLDDEDLGQYSYYVTVIFKKEIGKVNTLEKYRREKGLNNNVDIPIFFESLDNPKVVISSILCPEIYDTFYYSYLAESKKGTRTDDDIKDRALAGNVIDYYYGDGMLECNFTITNSFTGSFTPFNSDVRLVSLYQTD